MSLKIPLNQLVQSKYTSGDEYVFTRNTEIAYTGYYYETGGKIFAGKEFSPTSPELIRKTSIVKNTLIENPATSNYAKLSGMIINSTPIQSITFNPSKKDFDRGYITRYFAKKISSANVINIIEVNEETYMTLVKDPFYQSLKIDYKFNISFEELNLLDKQMLGLKTYLQQEGTRQDRFFIDPNLPKGKVDGYLQSKYNDLKSTL